MAMRLDEKKAVVAAVSAVAAEAHSVVAAEYRGLTVEQMTQLRRDARNGGVYLRVIKNTLARMAVKGTDFECIESELKGPLLLAFSQEDPGSAARLVKNFSKDNEKLVVRMLSIGGALLPANDLDRLASLPNREQALAMLLGVMQAPITKFVRTLAEPTVKMVRTFAAVRDSKETA